MKRLLFSLLCLVVFVAFAEGLVRLVSPDLRIPSAAGRLRFDQTTELDKPLHIRDDVLGWRFTPNARATLTVGDRPPALFTTNDAGFRGEPFDAYKDPKVYRVLVVGDSNAMGYGVGDQATYAAGLEELLRGAIRMRGVDPEVINLGVEGYSSHQARLVLERYAAELDPDAVVIQVGFNDHCLAPVPDDERSFSRPALLNGLEASHAYRWFRRQLLLATGAHERGFRPVPRVAPDDFVSNLRAMVEIAERAAALPVFVSTALRPSAPLTLNEVPVVDGADTTWVIQETAIADAFREAGYSTADDAPPEAVRGVLEALRDRHPTWPLPVFQLANRARAEGDSIAAAAYQETWRALDEERAVFGEYMDRARQAFPDSRLRWVDGERTLADVAAEEGWPNTSPLFLDFVHLGERGHAALALELTRQLAVHAAR